MITQSIINEYYQEHKGRLHDRFKEIEDSIDGRICHSSVLLLKIICELETINSFLEIGVHNGGSSILVIDGNDNLKEVYGIDLFSDMYSIDKHLNLEKFDRYQYFRRDDLSINKTVSNLQKFLPDTVALNLVQGNTYFDDTEEKFKSILNSPLDLIHIDGDHTADGIRNDFNRYSKYLKKNKFLVFDDYHHEPIKKFVDNISPLEFDLIGDFKFHEGAEQYLVKKLS